jgi:glucose uptake protein GlcU
VDPGNGLFFQFFMSTAILCAGFGVQMYRGNAFFYPYAMLGGMMWCIGNTMAVPALKLVSMGLAVALWGGSNMLFGWASGHFGFWGITKETEKVEWISYVGVGFSALGVVVLAFVKKNGDTRRHAGTGLMDEVNGYGTSVTSSIVEPPPSNPFERVELGEKEDINDYLSKRQQRVLGTFLAVAAGCFFGVNFDPPTLLMDEFGERSRHGMAKYSPNGLDYVFSHFFGIFVTSLVELVCFTGFDALVYLPTIFTPSPYQDLIVPGFVSGVGWAIGQISWFIANDNLGLVVSFPIICLGPSIVGCLWSVFLFKEIRGVRNYALLLASFIILAIAATCTVFAKNGF